MFPWSRKQQLFWTGWLHQDDFLRNGCKYLQIPSKWTDHEIFCGWLEFRIFWDLRHLCLSTNAVSWKEKSWLFIMIFSLRVRKYLFKKMKISLSAFLWRRNLWNRCHLRILPWTCNQFLLKSWKLTTFSERIIIFKCNQTQTHRTYFTDSSHLWKNFQGNSFLKQYHAKILLPDCSIATSNFQYSFHKINY